MTAAVYVTHARTMEELRAEFISDIERRLALVETRIKNSNSARRSTSLLQAREELESMKTFWTSVNIVHLKKKSI